MKKDIDSITVRRNLRSNTNKEHYWKTKILFAGLILLAILIVGSMLKKKNPESVDNTVDNIATKTEPIMKEQKIPINTQAPQTQKTIKIEALGASPGEVYTDFKNKMTAQNQPGITYKFIDLKKTYSPGKYEFVCEIQETNNGFRLFSLVFNPKNGPPESKIGVLKKNAGAQGIEDGVINQHEYHLIGIK